MDLKFICEEFTRISGDLFIKQYCEEIPADTTPLEMAEQFDACVGLQTLVSENWASDAKSGKRWVFMVKSSDEKGGYSVFVEERGLPMRHKQFPTLLSAGEYYFKIVFDHLRFARDYRIRQRSNVK